MKSRLAAILGLSLSALAATARGDGFDGQRFVPAAGAAGGFAVERPVVPKHLGFGAALFLSYALNPVVERDLATGRQVDQPLRHAFTLDFLGSIALFDHLEIAVHLPVDAVYIGDAVRIDAFDIHAAPGVGDFRLVPKVMFWRGGTARFNGAVGVIIPLSFPTGNAAELRGSGGFGLDPRLLGGIGGTRWDLTLNLGYRWRSNDGPANLYGTGEVTYGLAGTYTLPVWHDGVDLDAEIIGGYNHDAQGPTIARSPLELLLGVILWPTHDWSFFAGAGPGLTSGLGTPDVRVFTGVRYASRLLRHDEPFRDSDHDGIDDQHDRCVNEPEDKDGFEDSDGCPDPDNDRDGIADEEDECPDVAGERREGDGNGCPTTGYAVVRNGRLLIFGKILFETGSDRITESSQHLLDQIAALLKSHLELGSLEIQGHTDNVGPREMNLRLSHDRAASVRQSLIKRGVEGKRLTEVGYGEDRPVASNSTRGGRAKNRRVELVVTGNR